MELEGRRLEAGLPGRQGRLLFAYLVANRERIVTRDALAFVAWPTQAPSSADTSLRALLSRLRRLLGPEVLSGRQDLRLELPADAWVDLETAEARVHEAEAAVSTEDWDRAVVGATIAFQISRRGFLTGEDAPWIDEHRGRLEDIHLRALECDARASLGIGGSEVAAAARDARRLIDLAPYRESGYRLLMETLARQGNHGEALMVYDRLRSTLREALGTSPGPASRDAHRRLLDDMV